MEREERRRPPKRGGIHPMFVLLGGILAIAGLVIFVNSGAKPEAAKESTREAEFDPFASVPTELPRRTSTTKGLEDMATGGEILGNSVDFQSDPAWQAARAKADEAARLLNSALDAHSAGDSKTARENGKRAQELFSEALGDSRPLEDALRLEYGEDSLPAKRMGRTRQEWNRSVMTLKKAAFL